MPFFNRNASDKSGKSSGSDQSNRSSSSKGKERTLTSTQQVFDELLLIEKEIIKSEYENGRLGALSKSPYFIKAMGIPRIKRLFLHLMNLQINLSTEEGDYSAKRRKVLWGSSKKRSTNSKNRDVQQAIDSDTYQPTTEQLQFYIKLTKLLQTHLAPGLVIFAIRNFRVDDFTNDQLFKQLGETADCAGFKGVLVANGYKLKDNYVQQEYQAMGLLNQADSTYTTMVDLLNNILAQMKVAIADASNTDIIHYCYEVMIGPSVKLAEPQGALSRLCDNNYPQVEGFHDDTYVMSHHLFSPKQASTSPGMVTAGA